MSSGSQTVGDAVVPKFDMHVYASVLTSDEVNNLVAEYAIPSDLHPVFLPQGHWFSFERRSRKGGQGKIFNEFCTSLKHWKDCFFLIDRRAIPDAMSWRHQDFSVVYPPPIGVQVENVHRLCENVIDLRHVHLAMLYVVGLTTIWNHVGHHPVFKDGEGTGNIILLPACLNSLSSRWPEIPKKSDHQNVVEYENERVLAAKRKAHAAKDRALGKRAATEGASQRPKKKKTMPLSFALSDSKADGSNRSGSGTHHSTSPLNTIIPNEAELTTRGNGLILESVNRVEEDTDHHLDNVEDTTEVNSLFSEHSPHSQHSNPSDEGHGLSSSSGGLHRQAFPRRNPGGGRIGSSLRGDVGLRVPFVLAWNLTTHSILNDVESCRDMMINLATPAVRYQQNRLSDYQALQHSWFELGHEALAQIDILQRYEALNEDYGELYESHRSCQDVFDRLTEIHNQLVDTIQSQNKLSDDHKALQQVHLGCVGKEADLTEKLATRLLSSDEYKKSLSDVFNLAITDGWSKGVKAACSEEDAEAFLATAVDYDPACKTTFMSEFDSFFNKSYLYVEKLVESFQLPLGDLQSMWPEGTRLTLSGNAADVQ
ncbi:hypothetical protein Tco_1345457 [Tanacetum coccineum]